MESNEYISRNRTLLERGIGKWAEAEAIKVLGEIGA